MSDIKHARYQDCHYNLHRRSRGLSSDYPLAVQKLTKYRELPSNQVSETSLKMQKCMATKDWNL